LALDVTVVAHDPAGVDHHGVTPAPLPELLRRADPGSHIIDLTRYLAGDIVSVCATTHTLIARQLAVPAPQHPAAARAWVGVYDAVP
jgi:hypothetical protein